MRPQGRAILGYYPTPESVVRKIANMIKMPDKGTVSILDAGCGEGEALRTLAKELNGDVKLFGVEVDTTRAKKADAVFKEHGGECLWSGIEDADVKPGCSLLWFNPPYDNVRGHGRMESILFQKCRQWPERGGLIVAIVPEDTIFQDYDFYPEFKRYFEPLELCRFPADEYQTFKQWVLIGRRRTSALRYTPYKRIQPEEFVDMDELEKTFDVPAAEKMPKMRRLRLSKGIVIQTLAKSPARSHLLRESIKPAVKVERPLLPLKEGHLAMALAGGLCDGVVETDGVKFLVKGSLSSQVGKVATKEKTNKDGEITHNIDVYRTVYKMTVRCLRDDGTIEDYSSHDDEMFLEGEEEGQGKSRGKPSRLASRVKANIRKARRA